MTQTAPAGWFLDSTGLQYRYWDGTTWTEHVSPAVAPPSLPGMLPSRVAAEPMQWFEPFLFVTYLLLTLGIIGGAAYATAQASTSGKVAYSQEQLDRDNADARTKGQVVGLGAGLIALAIIASKVGYRGRDTFIQLIPLVGWVIWLKLLWRLACVQRNYWSPAPS